MSLVLQFVTRSTDLKGAEVKLWKDEDNAVTCGDIGDDNSTTSETGQPGLHITWIPIRYAKTPEKSKNKYIVNP